jgi:Putative prokaryotic signal transducing protein
MKEILRTSSISLAESLRLALEVEGISALVSNANLGGLPPGAITVAVVDDGDYDRGLVVLNQLQRPTFNAPPTHRRFLRALIIAIVGVVLILCANLF